MAAEFLGVASIVPAGKRTEGNVGNLYSSRALDRESEFGLVNVFNGTYSCCFKIGDMVSDSEAGRRAKMDDSVLFVAELFPGNKGIDDEKEVFLIKGEAGWEGQLFPLESLAFSGREVPRITRQNGAITLSFEKSSYQVEACMSRNGELIKLRGSAGLESYWYFRSNVQTDVPNCKNSR